MFLGMAETPMPRGRSLNLSGGIRRASAPFPWGSKWIFGLSFAGNMFRVYHPIVRIGQRLINLIDDSTVGEEYAELDVSGADESWGAAIDLDWTSSDANWGATLKLVTDRDDISTHPTPKTDTNAPERIAIAWFTANRQLFCDYVHGLYIPQVWVTEPPA